MRLGLVLLLLVVGQTEEAVGQLLSSVPPMAAGDGQQIVHYDMWQVRAIGVTAI